jgi:hypothetical protein
MASIGLGIMGLLGATGALGSAALGSNAATTAAGEQTAAEQNALNFQEQMFGTQQQNMAPYLSAGSSSLSQLMAGLQSGKFGSLPNAPQNAPQYTGGAFTAPTLAQAQQTPGYQFTAQQGSKGILEGAGAAGGAISGGTLKALDSYNTGLADSTYNDVFNRSLQTYNTGIQSYQAQLQGYQAQLQGYNALMGQQQQEYNQTLGPAQLGENSAASINNTGTQVSQNVGNLMAGIGNAQAAGTVGSTNAITSGITGATSSLSQAALLQMLLSGGGGNLGQNTPGGAVTLMGAPPISYGMGPG